MHSPLIRKSLVSEKIEIEDLPDISHSILNVSSVQNKEFKEALTLQPIAQTANKFEDNQQITNKPPLQRTNKFEANAQPKGLIKSTSQLVIRNHDRSPSPFINSPVKKDEVEKVKFESFTILRVLGSGSFGKVFLIQKKDDNRIFAMKVLKKKDLIFKKHLRYALTETNILKKCKHPFILRIHYSFQTPKHFYLVIDYCPRGDISKELTKLNFFKEEIAKFYIAELILAVEYLHNHNVIYRDLKPENILIGTVL